MAIPDGYRLLTANDVGKTFGVELESTVYFDTSVRPGILGGGFYATNFIVYSAAPDDTDIPRITVSSSRVYYNSSFTQESYTFSSNLEITEYESSVDWNNWFYVKETATPKEQFISDMNSLGKSITDKAGASGKKSITELKDLVDNLKTTFTGQEKTVTPSKTSQVITADSGYDGLSKVTVNVIPSSYIIPSGTLAISENGTKDVTQYASVNVNVPTPEPTYWDGTYIEEELASGYTLTLNCASNVLNSAAYLYSLDSGTTWNQFTSSTMTLENVSVIKFKSEAVHYYLKIGTTSGGYDIYDGWGSDDITITEDTTWYVNIVYQNNSGAD